MCEPDQQRGKTETQTIDKAEAACVKPIRVGEFDFT